MPAERPEPVLRSIGVVPLGDIDARRVDAVLRRLSRRVAVPCRRRPAVPRDRLPWLQQRPQLDADRLLAVLEDHDIRRSVGETLVGVTSEDLGHPLFTFFFGRARMGGVAIVSTTRLDPAYYGLPCDEDLLTERAVIECLHELGHVAGLHHCELHACVMHFSGSVEVIDLRGRGLCERCRSSLPQRLRQALHG